MRPLIALLIAFAPTTLFAAGAPVSSPPGSLSSVEVPCYPEGVFRLCPVPDVDVHAPGYLPRTTPTQARLYPTREGFVVLVSPNAAPYEAAVRDAARAAVAYCGTTQGERVAARIDGRARYAEEDLESWRFSGECE